MPQTERRRPHVIWLHSDQHNARMMGSIEGAWVRTPNLDRLAASGTSFTAAYCPSPLCAPSRMSTLTGRLPARINVETNAHALASHIPTIAHSMGASDYHPVLCGRMHFVGPDQRHGFIERLVGDHGPTDVAQREQPMGIFDGCTGQDGHNLTMSGPGVSTVMLYDEAVTNAACEYLAGYGADSPLFLSVGWYGPHNPFVCPRDLYDHYARVTPRITETERSERLASAHPAVRKWLDDRGLLDLDDAVAHRARVAYSGLVEFIDRQIGQVLTAAWSRFDPSDVLVVYSSDHGEMAGERGMFWKSNFYEGAVRVPWIWSYPGVIRPQVCDEPVSLLDFAPTLAALLDAPSLPEPDGMQLANVLTEASGAPLRPIVATLADRRCGPSAMVRLGPLKLIRYHDFARPELYNLDGDPDEQLDLAADETRPPDCEELERQLANHWDPRSGIEAISQAHESLPILRQWTRKQSPRPCEHWRADLELLRAPTGDSMSL